MNTKQQVIILSAELSNLPSDENYQRTRLLKEFLGDCEISFNQVMTVNKSGSEVSFLCLPKNDSDIQVLKGFAFKNFSQESVLYQDSNGRCYLEYGKDRGEFIGSMEQVASKYVEELENYIVLNGKIYTVVK